MPAPSAAARALPDLRIVGSNRRLRKETTMFRAIIVPLDGSSFGEYALPYAVAVARRTGSTLKLVHVHQTYMPGEALESIPNYQYQRIAEYDSRADESARREESHRLWELADRLSEQGVSATAHVLAGRIAEAIAGFARELPSALIVMSTHGYAGFHQHWLGSVADAVVRRSSTPVLLVRPTGDPAPSAEEVELNRILVPVDGSAFSTAIVGPVSSLAGVEQVEVTFYEAVPPDDAVAALSPLWPGAPRTAPLAANDKFLEKLLLDLPMSLGTARTKRVTGRRAAPAILEEAETGKYDLIAMATHGLGGAHHLLLGSTTDKVMRGTTMPILLFRPHGAGGAQAGAEGEVEALIVEEMSAAEVVYTT